MFVIGQSTIDLTQVPWHLILAFLAWAAIWTQFVLVPFFFKGEKLHQDYFANGKLNEALSQIEADRLIPALADMFRKVMDSRSDKRERPDFDTLLNSVNVLPDLESVQAAIAEMQKVKMRYSALPRLAQRVWIVALIHIALCPCLPAFYLFVLPTIAWSKWVLAGLVLAWVLSLLLLLWWVGRFHRELSGFTRHLEKISSEG